MKSPGADKAIDSNSATKWFDYTNSPLQVQLATPLKVEAGFHRGTHGVPQVTTGFNTKMVIYDLDHWGVPSGNLT
jgi:hypothetical protein